MAWTTGDPPLARRAGPVERVAWGREAVLGQFDAPGWPVLLVP